MESESHIKHSKQYLYGKLENVAAEPFEQFNEWFKLAYQDLPEKLANSMVLATTDKDCPSARIVLLKDYGPQGFTFYTNYLSRKGQEIAENANVALLFWWEVHERQVRIEGIAEKISHQQSEAYFHTRPKGSQIAALASQQSRPLENWHKFIADYQELLEQYSPAEISVPCPENWGGYIVRPKRFEFWQGRDNRMHDRFQYTLESTGWVISRLYP